MRLAVEDWVFDADTRAVIRAGIAVPLSPKAFDLLSLLIEERPRAVSKEEIHDKLWPSTHVAPANLANLIVELRAALGDSARKSRVIGTVQRFGYAFRADAREVPRTGGVSSAGAPAYRLIWGPREIALDPGENLIGRDRDSVVWIDDASVSRRHARIVVGDSGATLEDLGSKNGTRLRGRRVSAQARLADKDTVQIGPASLVFRVFKKTASTVSTMEGRARK
ncbi:MAG TPA: FHA domain-containing protein [Thermoanaerobaculia bacterium]